MTLSAFIFHASQAEAKGRQVATLKQGESLPVRENLPERASSASGSAT